MNYLLVMPFGCLLLTVLYQWARHQDGDNIAKFRASLPAIGVVPGKPCSWIWAALVSITKTAQWASQGYYEICKKLDEPFILPKAGIGAIVVLPPSQLHQLNKAEDHLIAYEAQLEVIQPRYMTKHQALYDNPIHFDIVRKHLTKDVGTFVALTAEELGVAFRRCWGDDYLDWKTVSLWDTSTHVISQAANRAFFGLPLCRNENLLKQTALYAASVYQMAALLSSVPESLRPIFGPLLAIPAKRQLNSCQRLLIPMVAERLRGFARKDGTLMPNDALQWMIDKCAKVGKTELEPANIAERLLNLNLVSSWTTSYTFAYSVLDLYSSRYKDDFVAGLRSECESVRQEYGDLASKGAIDKLYRVDSAVRESMRISPFSVVALPRIIPPGNGLDIGGNICVPPGVRISFPFQAIHHDPSNYENPLEYDAFRFSRQFERPKGTEVRDEARLFSTSVTEDYISYGYGKHACPGRWFASQMLKQALSHVLLHYEVECVEPLPAKTFLFNALLPPKGARIRIKRR